MVKINAVYLGEKHCQALHEPSQSTLETDAPKDNNGRGAAFSPTDLLATSLGTCVLTTIAIFAEKDGLNVNGARMEVVKEMTSAPRKVGSLTTKIFLSSSLTSEQRKKYEEIGNNCPVKLSLHPDVKVALEYAYT